MGVATRWKYKPWLPLPKPPLPKSFGGRADRERFVLTKSDHVAWDEGFRIAHGRVDHFLDFCRVHLRYVKGRWGGQPIEFLPWQIESLIAPLYGWVHPGTGLRRFRRAYVELTKKQGKTTLASCMCLYAMLADEEQGANVFSNGPTYNQAGLAWDIAADMIEASESLSDCVAINRQNRLLRVPSTQSTWKALAHSTTGRGSAQGFDASFMLNDELHEWPNFEHWRQIQKAGLARAQPLFLSITNAGLSKDGPCWAEHETACRIANGEQIERRFLPLVFQTDEDEAEAEIDAVGRGSDDIPVAIAANPSIDQIVSRDEIISDIRQAYHTPGERGNCLRLTYSVWRSFGDTPWIGHLWDDCADEFDESTVMGKPCWCGLDVASVQDFTAASFVFAMDRAADLFHVLVYYWMSEERVANLSRFILTDQWAREGWIRTNPGRTTDHTKVMIELSDLIRQFSWQNDQVTEVPMLLYDPRMADVITRNVSDETGCDRVEFRQTNQNYHAPVERFEGLVGDGRLRHNGNPVLSFHAMNARVISNLAEHKRPIRPGSDKDERTIDGVVATIMALSQIDAPPTRKVDFYEHNDLEVI